MIRILFYPLHTTTKILKCSWHLYTGFIVINYVMLTSSNTLLAAIALSAHDTAFCTNHHLSKCLWGEHKGDKTTDITDRSSGFKTQFCHLTVVWLCAQFLICQMGMIIIVNTSQTVMRIKWVNILRALRTILGTWCYSHYYKTGNSSTRWMGSSSFF